MSGSRREDYRDHDDADLRKRDNDRGRYQSSSRHDRTDRNTHRDRQDRKRSPRRQQRSRSRSPSRQNQDMSHRKSPGRETRQDRYTDDVEKNEDGMHNSEKEIIETTTTAGIGGTETNKQQQRQPEANDEISLDAELSPEEIQMMIAMGIPYGFDTTQGKHVEDDRANVGAVRSQTKRTARQYMNRKGGFNKALPSERTGEKVVNQAI